MHEERWLVKSSGRILGPFTLEELIQHLRARTLSIIDEIRDSGTRWSFIRENALLRDVVRQLRDEDEERFEATQTSVTSHTSTRTLTLTENTDDMDELTPNPTIGGNQGLRSSDARPIRATERNIRASVAGDRAYGSLNDPRVQGQIEQTRRLTRGIVIGVAALAFVVAGFWFFNQKRNKFLSAEQAKQWIMQAREQLRYGQRANALNFYQKAYGVTNLEPEDRINYSALLLQVEGKTADPLRIMSEIQKLSEPRLIRELSMARTLVYLRQQRWNEATLEVNSVLNSNPRDEEGLHNQALLQFYRGHIVSSWGTVNSLMDKGYRSSQLLILKGLLALSWPERNGQHLRLVQAADDLKRDVESNYELHFEKNLLLVNLRLHLGKLDEAMRVLAGMWGADPFDSRNFLMPLVVDQQIISWDRLFPLCERILKTFPDHEGARAIRAVCLAQRGETAQALQSVDEARKRLSQSSLLAATQALLYFQVGRTQEAKTLTQLSQNEPLGQLMLGQLCESEHDWSCAERAWASALEKAYENPMAIYGQAMALKQRGNELVARDLIRKAIIKSPGYRPFLEARGESNVF